MSRSLLLLLTLALLEDALDQRHVEAVARTRGDDVCIEIHAGVGDVADQVEDLVACELVFPAQRVVLRTVRTDDQRVPDIADMG